MGAEAYRLLVEFCEDFEAGDPRTIHPASRGTAAGS